MLKDAKINYIRHKKEMIGYENTIKGNLQELKQEGLVPVRAAALQHSIDGLRKEILNCKKEMMRDKLHFLEQKKAGSEIKAVKDTHHEQLKQRYNFDANKATRMANQPNTSRSFADIEALMKQRLGNQNPTTTEAR